MKKNNKKIIIDKYGLCLNEYKDNLNNAEIYYKRAIGKLPEMETSKAMAKVLNKLIVKNDKVLDVGCASGHFYRSLSREIKKNFYYTGIDPYEIFLNKAKMAWKKKTNVKFVKGNIYNLPFENKEYDISYSSNVFIHLNDIITPLKELLRVSRKYIILRTVLYDVSYKIQLVYNNKWWKYIDVKPADEFDAHGQPRAFSYFNILSKDYLVQNIKRLYRKAKIKIIKDNFFKKNKIILSGKKEKRPLATRIIGNEQVSGLILQPHYFVIISK